MTRVHIATSHTLHGREAGQTLGRSNTLAKVLHYWTVYILQLRLNTRW